MVITIGAITVVALGMKFLGRRFGSGDDSALETVGRLEI
jgi:hypothetical protein